VYCLANAIKDNNMKRCTNIIEVGLYEYFAIFALQVGVIQKQSQYIIFRALTFYQRQQTHQTMAIM
jgi:hypothetical protein